MAVRARAHVERREEALPWHGQYPYLSLLILYSTNLPLPLQAAIGENLLATIRRYLYFLKTYACFKKVDVLPLWCYYLNNKQGQRWLTAHPSLHKAYSLIGVLPPPVLNYMDQRAIAVVNTLCCQMLSGQVDFKKSKARIQDCLYLTMAQLMQLPAIPQCDDYQNVPEIEAVDLLGDDVLLKIG